MKTHRGLSAVVGTVFLIAVVIGALSYISYSMDIMGNFSENLIAEETRQRNIRDESFDLLTVDIVSEKLDATIKNTGEIPVKITTLYLDEMGTNTDAVQKITIDKIIAPGNSFDFFSENIDIDVDSTKGYSMKLVSSRGESQTFYLNSASQEPLDIRLIASPDRVPTGFSSTIMMVVVNNMSNNNPLVNLTPIQPDCSGVCTDIDGPFPASYDLLEAGDVALFRWVVVLDGNDGQSAEFTSGLQNGVPLNTDSKTVTVTPVQVSELAGSSIESAGFGQSELTTNILVLHIEDHSIPDHPDPPADAIPDPIHNYELNGDATDEMGGTDLQLSDSGVGLSSTGWDFKKADNAQIVSGDIPDTEYAIEIVFKFKDNDRYPRLLDYHNHEGSYIEENPDYGIYSGTSYIEFYDDADSGGGMGNDVLTHVLIQRDSDGNFEMYQDGAEILSFDDSSGPDYDQEATFFGATSDNSSEQPATFFKDDSDGTYPEDSDGFVDCIRIFDEALSSANAITLTSDSDTCYSFTLVANANYQMNPTASDASGMTLVFDDISDRLQWYSANVTTADTTIAAGDWDASLRYNHAALPSELNIADIGMKLHFEETNTSTDLYDSGNDSNCYSLAESGNSGVNGAQWYSDRGVNGSGAYHFDGIDDSLTIQIDGKEAGCLNIHHQDYSVSGWFNATINDDYNTAQYIFTVWDDSGDGGGFRVKIGDGSDGNHGQVIFTNLDDEDGDKLFCYGDEPDGNGGRNYMDNQWHHFVATMSGTECNLYVDGVWKDDNTGGGDGAHWDMDEMAEDFHIGSHRDGTSKEFTGYIDDIMFWYDLEMTQAQVTALKNFSFGNNATNLNFYLNNATGVGDTLDVLAAEENVGMSWGDPHRRIDSEDLWIGGNWTVNLPQVGLKEADPFGRLNFTIGYASGAPLNLRVDDSDISGSGTSRSSSYIQTPPADPELPFYRSYDNDSKITFFTYNGQDEGVWFTFQGTRMVFNGTGGHYTGVVDTVSNGIVTGLVNVTRDSPFVDKDVGANIIFWHPQNIPTASEPIDDDKIIPGNYDVVAYLNGYDEDGSILLRSIHLGSVEVVD